MEETCRAKGCIFVWRFHSLVSTAPSQSYSPPRKLSEPKYLCTVEVSRNRLIDWSIGVWSLIWISVPVPLPRDAETMNLYSPHWVLSIQFWVFGTPPVCGYRIVFQKSSPDLWNRIHFKSFRRPASWNRKRIKHGKDNNSQKTTGKGPGDFCSILCFHPTSSFTNAVAWSPAIAFLRDSTSFDFL